MQKEIILLDGGMGQELIRNSKSKPHPLWSTYVMSEEPELVRKAHVDFIEAGASIVTLNTYSTTPERLEANDLLDKFSFFATSLMFNMSLYKETARLGIKFGKPRNSSAP